MWVGVMFFKRFAPVSHTSVGMYVRVSVSVCARSRERFKCLPPGQQSGYQQQQAKEKSVDAGPSGLVTRPRKARSPSLAATTKQ